MKLSIAILHHPKRTEFIDELVKQLPMAKVITDVNSEGILINSRKAWECYDKDSDYHLVLDDDSILTDNFYDKACEILKEDVIYSLCWTIRKLNPIFIKLGMYKDNWLIMGNATCMPTKFVDEMLGFTKCVNVLGSKTLPKDKAFDTRIAIYARHKGLQIHYPIPSLVQHGGDESLVGHTRIRKAIYFK